MGGQTRDFGPTAVLRVACVDVLIVSIAHRIPDLGQFETSSIDARACSTIALRPMQQFRAAFAPIAGRIVVCDGGALATVNHATLDDRAVPRPSFPLDVME